MYYQLSSGKVIQITLEQYLDMSDDDFHLEIQRLTASNSGDNIHNPFHGSVIKNSNKDKKKEDTDNSIDYEPEYEESSPLIINDEDPLEDLPEAPEDLEDLV